MKKGLILGALALLLLAGCARHFRAEKLEWKNYRVRSGPEADSAMMVFLRPYADSVNQSMNEVIAEVGVLMEKKQPEGGLGNSMTDAFLFMAREKFGTHVDAAVMNYGGIRLPALVPGPLTRGKIFELMPFDNLLLLQTLKGSVLQEFLDRTAAAGGWPVSGISYTIKGKKAVDVFVGNKPLNPEKEYVIANSDYIINGGDGINMLSVFPSKNIGYLMRVALMDYYSGLAREGKRIVSIPENRVRYAD